MRAVVSVLAVVLMAGSVPAQEVERTVSLVDTLGRGCAPTCLGWNPATSKLYAAGYGGWVVAVDVRTGAVTSYIPAGSNDVGGILCSPEDNRVYWTNSDSSTVSVANGATDRLVTRLDVGYAPGAIARDPARNMVYAACYFGEVAVIDGGREQVTDRIRVGREPAALCFNPRDGRLWCANSGSSNVTAIDCATDSVLATVAVGRGPMALACGPADGRVYCANNGCGSTDSTLSVINPADCRVVSTAQVNWWPTALCYDSVGNRMFCVSDCSRRNLAMIDCAGDSVVGKVTVRGAPCAVACDPGSNRVYCVSVDSSCVTVVDGATNEVVATVAVGAGPTAVLYVPELDRVVVANTRDASISVIR
jgi:YVTN family beta-propeller protein